MAPQIPYENSYIESQNSIITGDMINMILLVTLSTKLCNLREKQVNYIDTPLKTPLANKLPVQISNENDPFGVRLSKWRNMVGLTQKEVSEKIIEYKVTHGIYDESSVKSSYDIFLSSTLRTYQNWEAKKNNYCNFLITIQDLKMLKTIMECDYEYLFGEINSLKCPQKTTLELVGLSEKTINKLEDYNNMIQFRSNNHKIAFNILTSIDLIVSNDELLNQLGYFFSNLSLYIDYNCTRALKPIHIFTNDGKLFWDTYSEYLFNEDKDSEIKNILLPDICKNLNLLREDYIKTIHLREAYV